MTIHDVTFLHADHLSAVSFGSYRVLLMGYILYEAHWLANIAARLPQISFSPINSRRCLFHQSQTETNTYRQILRTEIQIWLHI